MDVIDKMNFLWHHTMEIYVEHGMNIPELVHDIMFLRELVNKGGEVLNESKLTNEDAEIVNDPGPINGDANIVNDPKHVNRGSEV